MYLNQEFIGRKCRLIRSSDVSKTGLEGIVVNETHNLLIVKVEGILKKIPKVGNLFEIYFDKWIEIEGDLINIKPENRIKIKSKW